MPSYVAGNALLDCSLNDAHGFVQTCAANGHPGGTLLVNPFAAAGTDAGDEVAEADFAANSVPDTACYLIRFPESDPRTGHDFEVGLCLFYLNQGDTLEEVLQ